MSYKEDVIKFIEDNVFKFIDKQIDGGNYSVLVLVGILTCLYIFRSELPKFVSWAFPSKLSKVHMMLDSGLLDEEMTTALIEQYRVICFKRNWYFVADEKLRFKIWALLKQDDRLRMFDFRRAREYYDFKNDQFMFKLTFGKYFWITFCGIFATFLSVVWLSLYFYAFTHEAVSIMQWIFRIGVLLTLGLFCGMLFWELSKFSGARKLSLIINGQQVQSICQYWMRQLRRLKAS